MPVAISPLLRASHPEPTVAVTVVAAALAASAGRSPAGVLAVAAAVLAGQLSVGWCNDAADAGRDVQAGRHDKPVAAGEVPIRTVAAAAGLALTAAAALSLFSGWRAALAHLAAIALAWAYNLRLKFSAASVLPYALAFGLLPVFVTLGLSVPPGASGLPPWWAVLGGALLGAGAHVTNTLPDLDDDLAAGVRGLPHRLGAARSRRLSAALLLAASAVLALGPGRPGGFSLAVLGLAVVLVLVGARLRSRPQSRLAFRLTLLVALLDVALLVARGSALT